MLRRRRREFREKEAEISPIGSFLTHFGTLDFNTTVPALALFSAFLFCFLDSDGSCYHSSCRGDGRQLPVILSCHPCGGGPFPPSKYRKFEDLDQTFTLRYLGETVMKEK